MRKGVTETPGVQMEPGPSNDSQGRSGCDEYENYSRGSHVNSRGRPWTQNSRGHGWTGGDGRGKNWQRDQQTTGRGRGAWSFGQNNQQVDYVARQKKLDYVNEPSSSGVSRPTNNQNNTSRDGGAKFPTYSTAQSNKNISKKTGATTSKNQFPFLQAC